MGPNWRVVEEGYYKNRVPLGIQLHTGVWECASYVDLEVYEL